MNDAAQFKDLFSGHADEYAKFRPGYPGELFKFLSIVVKSNLIAWDCATGNGQAALGLAPYFKHVIATDASRQQITAAMQHKNISYSVVSAYETSTESNSVDLITVAQALHWFDLNKFFVEAQRVLTKNGIIAVWCYNLMQVSKNIDELIQHLYFTLLKDCWSNERRLVENAYRDINFPFKPVASPKFIMRERWTLDVLIGYIKTWSAVKKYQELHTEQPIDLIKDELQKAWGDPSSKKTLTWPLTLKVGELI